MKKRILSLALVLCMVLTLLPMSAFAESGTCGDKLTWTLDKNGTLTIIGTGAIDNYSSASYEGTYATSAPWGQSYASIKSVVIGDGVTSIGDYAFRGCSSLTNITMPSSLISIGSSAFRGCTGLTDITIPNGVTSIGGSAFRGCTGLTGITMPSSLISIGSSAIEGCSGLTDITIPFGVTSIGSSAFYGCSGLESITIPNSVSSIGGSAFSGCSSLKSITVPSNVTAIGQYTFFGCSSLTDIKLPKGVTSIGAGAFERCSSLTEITIPDGVTGIGLETFYGCSSLKSFTIPSKATSIGSYAFYGCSSLTEITIPKGVTVIGAGAFQRCDSLTSITIPYGVTNIGSGEFYGCTSLTSVTIPSSVSSIGAEAFGGCNRLASITIPSGVTSIGSKAFRGCNSLEDVAFGGSKEAWAAIGYSFDIDVRVHYNCTSLETHYVLVETVEASCDSMGYNTYCCDCGYEAIELIPPNHDYILTETAAATCSSHGYASYKCSMCTSTKTEYFNDELLPHDYKETIFAPSCTLGGYTDHVCSVCKTSYKDSIVQPLGHNYVDGICTRCKGKDPSFVSENPFTDVSENAAYYDAVLWGSSEGIVSGFTATEFRPNATCTRAQVVTFLWRAAGSPEPTSTNNPFKDVSAKLASGKDNPFYKAILWGVERGITSGYSDGTFRPNDTVTRAQFVTFLWRYENKPTGSTALTFKDADTIAKGYRDAVAWGVEKGVIAGYGDGSFRPNATCTRWQVVLFMWRDMKDK